MKYYFRTMGSDVLPMKKFFDSLEEATRFAMDYIEDNMPERIKDKFQFLSKNDWLTYLSLQFEILTIDPVKCDRYEDFFKENRMSNYV